MELLLDRFAALGTAWWIEARLPSGFSKEILKNEIIVHLTRFEERYSRFRSDSLVGQLNQNRTIKNPDEELTAILMYAQSLYARTNNAFNFLVCGTLVSRGYGNGLAAPQNAKLPHPEHDLEISIDAITLHAGGVDFGGFGKGYLIDELATMLRRYDLQEFIINGGGDIYASHDGNAPIPIHLEHPTETGTYLGTTALFQQGFAASSPYKRVWKRGEKIETHIVGATEYASFVKAGSARDADAFATAALLLDDTTLRTVADHEGIGVARYSPATTSLTCHNFSFQPV